MLSTPFSQHLPRIPPFPLPLALPAVLKADLIGFHTYDYARHFVSACTRILGLEGTPSGARPLPPSAARTRCAVHCRGAAAAALAAAAAAAPVGLCWRARQGAGRLLFLLLTI